MSKARAAFFGGLFIALVVFAIMPIAAVHAVEEEETTTCANSAIPPEGIKLEIPLGVERGDVVLDLPDYLGKFYQFVIASIAILAAVKIVIAGFNWTFAAGAQDKIGSAKEDLSSALWGLLIALLSYTILNVVNPNLLKIPKICPPGPKVVAEDANYGDRCKSDAECGLGYHCAVSRNVFGLAGEWKREYIGGNCVDGRPRDDCTDLTGEQHNEWCQSGDCDFVTGWCDHPDGIYYGKTCYPKKNADEEYCGGIAVCMDSGGLGGWICSDGRQGAPCKDYNGKTADQYCKSGFTCQDGYCAPPSASP